MKADVIGVGGGPAGMMAAGVAARSGLRVLLLEKNPRLGRKLPVPAAGMPLGCPTQPLPGQRFLYVVKYAAARRAAGSQ